MSTEKKNQSLCWDVFLRRLLAAPAGKQESTIKSALALLDGKPPEDRLLYNGREAARLCGITYQTLWRLCKTGAIKPVHIRGLNRPRYSRKSLEDLITAGRGAQ